MKNLAKFATIPYMDTSSDDDRVNPIMAHDFSVKQWEQFCAKLCRLGDTDVAIKFIQPLICFTGSSYIT